MRLDEMAKAISADFGNRSQHETLLAEANIVFAEIDDALHHLKRWMKPKRRKAGWKMWPAKAEIRYVPLGVIGVIAPWNYPVNLALAPLVAAIAAGNHVFLKPSEHTPRTAAFLKSLLADVFPEDRVAVALGDAALSAQFSALPFDHLFFTGSTAVGRKVMAAAARNLTPVTLELGGKSPAIISENANLKRAARAIATGKFFNAGQTCIAPDYVLVHHSKRDEFVALLRAEMEARYSSPHQQKRPHDHHQRGAGNAACRSARRCRGKSEAIIELLPLTERTRLMPPALVMEPTPWNSAVRRVLNPLLPVISYRLLDDAITHVLEHDRPLALYCFQRQYG